MSPQTSFRMSWLASSYLSSTPAAVYVSVCEAKRNVCVAYLLSKTHTVGDDFGATAAAAPPAASALRLPAPPSPIGPPADCTISVYCGLDPNMILSFVGPSETGHRACNTVLGGERGGILGTGSAARMLRGMFVLKHLRKIDVRTWEERMQQRLWQGCPERMEGRVGQKIQIHVVSI